MAAKGKGPLIEGAETGLSRLKQQVMRDLQVQNYRHRIQKRHLHLRGKAGPMVQKMLAIARRHVEKKES